ncbi:MAG TPA: efflux RND transporter periplasmic adaptor subunit [Bacteroidia bacterium]|nr:efflux RND transporter periplasmic adaptor subunit [Bacteroidia bacterium]
MKKSIMQNMNSGISIFAMAVTLIISSCSSEPKKEEAPTEENHHEESGTEVEINSTQYKQLDIRLSEIEHRSMTATLRTTGYLKVPPQNKAAITSSIGGTVQSILVMEGDYVQKGQTVATLSNPAFIKMQEDFLHANAQLTFAEADYTRQKELSEKNVSAQKTFQQAAANYNSLKAKVNSLKQQLTLLNVSTASLTAENIASVLQIKTPISGNISHIDINIGTTVEPSKELMDIVDNSQLHLDMFLFEQDLLKVTEGQLVELWLTNLPGKHYHAKVFGIGSAFEGESKSIPVHAAITGDKKGLIEGMNVTAMISTLDNLATVVPSSAITSFGGSEYIFIQTHGHDEHPHQHSEKESKAEQQELGDIFSFQRIAVKKGITSDGYTEIIPLENLPEHTKVVTNGSYYLNAMLTNESEGHEH